MVSALLFGVAFTYPEKVFASAEGEKGTGMLVAPLLPDTRMPESEAGDVRTVGTGSESNKEPSSNVGAGAMGLERQMAQISLSVAEPPVSDELAAFVNDLPRNERRLFLTLLDDPTSAALLMMAAQNPRFVEAIKNFRLVPAGVQREYLQSQHAIHDAMSNTPRSYRGLNSRADIDDLPLSATLEESAWKVFYDSNSLYLSYLFLNLVIWTGTGFAVAAQGTVIPSIWKEGAMATIFESDMVTVCDLVEDSRKFMLDGPLVGGLELSTRNLVNAACVGIGMAALPGFAQNLFMPLVMVGVLSVMKLAYGAMEHRKDRAMGRSAFEDLGRTVKLLEQRLSSVDMEQLILADETRAALEEIAKKPGELLPVAVGISHLSEQDFEEVSAAVFAITKSLNDTEITESNWKTTLKRLLHIEPYEGGQPRTSGIVNALYNIFADRRNVRIYAPLVSGFVIAFTLHNSVAITIGALAPHIAVIGGGAQTIIAPTSNLTLLCQTLNLTGSMPVGANVSGTVIQAGDSGLGTLLNTFAASFLAIAMSKLYDPIQRLFTNHAVRGWMAWVASFCDKEAQDKDETEVILLNEHATRMHTHTRTLRRRTGIGQQNVAEDSSATSSSVVRE